MSFNPQQTCVHLGADGLAKELPGGPAFWTLPEDELAVLDSGWLVSEYEFTSDWSTWEMHPNGDEFVYLLSGAIKLLLEESKETRSLSLVGTGAVVVPRGVWHTAKVSAPSRVLHVTLGAGTQTRPASADGT